ncbi:MAG: hypothetical protein K9L78_04400 [Victivallales bacterium]|nr:hypothetical protein [Victivallales bacterium]
MKNLLFMISLFTLLFTGNLFAGPIKQFILDSNIVYTLKISKDGSVTTVMFPSAIQGIYGSNIIDNPSKAKKNGVYLLTYQEGNYYFSIKAVRPEQTASLNIVFNRKIYVIKLKSVTKEEAYNSVTFESGGNSVGGSNGGGSNKVAPSILVSTLDKAKMYPLLLQQYPDNVANIQYKHRDEVFKYKGYSVRLNAVYRFNEIDTLVFWIILTNSTDKKITYDPANIAVRCGEKIYFSSLAEASGVIPPNGTTQAYFCITGTPDGGRNWLSVDNNFLVLLAADNPDNQSTENKTGAMKKLILEQKIKDLNLELDKAKTPEEISRINREFTTIKNELKNINMGDDEK